MAKKVVSLDELSRYDEKIKGTINTVDTKVNTLKNKFFDGNIGDWSSLSDEEKETYLIAAVEDSFELSQAEKVLINNSIGIDAASDMETDIYSDEVMNITNNIVEGGR